MASDGSVSHRRRRERWGFSWCSASPSDVVDHARLHNNGEPQSKRQYSADDNVAQNRTDAFGLEEQVEEVERVKVVRVAEKSEDSTLTRAFNRMSQNGWLQERSAEQAAAKRAAVEEVTTIQLLQPGDLTHLPSVNRQRATKVATKMPAKMDDANSCFKRYDRNWAGYLTREDLFEGFKVWHNSPDHIKGFFRIIFTASVSWCNENPN